MPPQQVPLILCRQAENGLDSENGDVQDTRMNHQSSPKNAVARQSTQVEEMQSQLSSAIDNLHAAIEAHAEKIKSVVRSEIPAPGEKGECAPDSALVPAADFLRSQFRRVRNLTLRLEDITSRTEA